MIPALAIVAATKSGPGLNPDSITYLSSGLNLAQGNGLVTYSLDELTDFPPGLPLLIAAGSALGIDGYWTARIVNILSMMAVVLLTSALLRRHVSSRLLTFGGMTFVAVSAALLALTDRVLSEPIFIAVTLTFLLALENALALPNKPGFLVATIVLAWIAFALRYAGLALIPIGATALLTGLWSTGRRRALARAGTFTAGALAGPTLLILRNIRVSESLMGTRVPSSDTPGMNISRLLTTFGGWAIPSTSVPQIVLAPVGATILALTAWALWRSRATLASTDSQWSIVPLITFIAGYSIFMVVSVSNVSIDPLNARLLSALYVPLVLTVFVAVDRQRSRTGPGIRKSVGIGLACILVLQLGAFASEALRGSAGLGYAAPKWRNSALIETVSHLPKTAVVYSSQPDAIWAHTRRQPVKLAPSAKLGRTYVAVDEIPEKFLHDAACATTYLAWFNGNSREYLKQPAQLEPAVRLVAVSTVEDGVLYRVLPVAEQPNCAH